MRVDLVPSPYLRPWQEVKDFHFAADEIGLFDSVWSADHFMPARVNPGATSPILLDGPAYEAWTLTAILAGQTRRIRLGPLVTCVGFRHPALLARIVALCDIESGGRINLALGGGWSSEEAHRFGIPFGGHATRMARLAETAKVIKALFVEDGVTFSGEFISLEDARLDPKPLQKPGPPILIGGTNDRVIPIVAQYADIWDVPFATRQGLDEHREKLASSCESFGRDASEIAISTVIYYQPGEDLKAFAERVSTHREMVDIGIIGLKPEVPPSVLEPLAEALMDVGGFTIESVAAKGI
jgi:alkanesulfonate monooxygenase SsuD/methylene tetrahydromethanopterin reductase-like flavin-dependent oxidoreductase (luciferase family)